MEAQPVATVVVPTWARPEALTRCLETLARQTIRDDLEVIVVLDGVEIPADAERAGVRTVGTGRRSGPAAARNLGTRLSTAELVLFLDDDCEAAPTWAERLVEGLRREQVVAGRTRGGERYAQATQLITDELMGIDGAGYALFTPTMNVGCRRRVLLDVPFDESFPAAAGEDRAWCAALRAHGVTIAVAEDAVVEHFPAAGFLRFVRQHARYGRGSARLRSTSGAAERPAGFYRGLARRAATAGAVTAALVAVAQAATSVGVVSEQVARLTERRRR